MFRRRAFAAGDIRVLDALAATIEARKHSTAEKSYTRSLGKEDAWWSEVTTSSEPRSSSVRLLAPATVFSVERLALPGDVSENNISGDGRYSEIVY